MRIQPIKTGVLVLVLLSIELLHAQTHYVFDGVGAWTDTGLWSPSYPGSTIGVDDTMTITGTSELLFMPGTGDIDGVLINEGFMRSETWLDLHGSGLVINNGTYEVVDSSLFETGVHFFNIFINNGSILLPPDDPVGIPEYVPVVLSCDSLYNYGLILSDQPAQITEAVVAQFWGAIMNYGTMDLYVGYIDAFVFNYDSIRSDDFLAFGLASGISSNRLYNYGYVDGPLAFGGALTHIINSGLIEGIHGAFECDTFINSGAVVIDNLDAGYITNDSLLSIDNHIISDELVNTDTLLIGDGTSTNQGPFLNSHFISIAGPLVNNDTIVNLGQLQLDSATITNEALSSIIDNLNGTIAGTGTFDEPMELQGIISPGFSPGILNFTDVILDTNATLEIGLEGNNGPGLPGGYDQINGADITIMGNIVVQPDGYIPAHNDTFHIVSAGSLTYTGTITYPPVALCEEWEAVVTPYGITIVYHYPDTDFDGTCDDVDGCPYDPLKTEPGACGCGIAEVDSNNNGILDCEEVDAMIFRSGSTIAEGTRLSGHVLDADTTQLWYVGSRTDQDSAVMLMNRRNDLLQLGTNNAIRMTLDTAGRLGIGRIPTDHALEVQGSASKTVPGDWLGNSDARLKTNIQSLDPDESLEKLLLLEGVTFTWNDTISGYARPTNTQIGLTAQNVTKVFPSLVKKDRQGLLQTSYGTLDPVFIEAIRALSNQVLKLEKSVEELKAQLKKGTDPGSHNH